MTLARAYSILLVFVAVLWLPLTAQAEIGTAVDVDPAASLASGGDAVSLVSGARLSVGDVIQTNGRGQAQILFDDDTKIVVGPNSRFVITDIQMGSANSANRFAVDAIRGSFRFISGKSPKNAFEITTPHATIGVRGTTFDIDVFGETILASLRGVLEFCGSADCVIMRARCSVVVADRNGAIRVPVTTSEAGQLIRSGFPYIEDQRPRLLPAFRASVRSCRRFQLPRTGNGQNEDNARFEIDSPPTAEPGDVEEEEEEEDEGDDDDFYDDDDDAFIPR